ncbi:MAG: SDR family NAD(P)-dependent oxidoreductase [Variovorax sp.]
MDFFSDLKNKRVVITGACGVIGRWIVQAYQEAGCAVCLTDTREADLKALAQSVGIANESFVCAADLTDESGIETLVAEVGKRWGAADVLVNNAGVYPSGFLLDISTAEFDRIFSINLRAPYILSKGLALQMIERKVKGSIINISSGASRKMRRTVVPYCVSKTALDRLTKGFAIELAEFGIRANTLEPGFVAGSAVSALTDTHIKKTVANIPLARPTTLDDVRNGLYYLASDASSFVTGSTLTIDGGNSIGSLDVHQEKKNPL